MKIFDISQPLSQGIAVWPGDSTFSFSLARNMHDSSSVSVNVGKLSMSTHTGTHIDAPFHFNDSGAKVLDMDLDTFVGPTQVVYLPVKGSIGASDLQGQLATATTRLLIRTDAWPDRRSFPKQFPYLHPDVIPLLAAQGIKLIGVDTPSVDAVDSTELPVHQQLQSQGIAILECAVLDNITPGNYELIALPLALSEADASPVRAILRQY